MAAVLAATTVGLTAGCSGGGSPAAAPTGSPAGTAPPPAAAGVPAAVLEAAGLAAGQTWTSSVGDTATYYSSATSGSHRIVDAGFCAAAGAGAADVSAHSWVLITGDGRLVRPTGTSSAASPSYPDAKLVEAGACLRGRVGFDVPADVDVVRVGYEPQGDPAPLATWNP